MASSELPITNSEMWTLLRGCIENAQLQGAASDGGERQESDIAKLKKLHFFLTKIHPRATVTYTEDDVELIWRYK